MLAGQQGAQSVNSLPWVWNQYLPGLAAMLQQQPQAAAAAPQQSPLQQLLGMMGPNQTGGDDSYLRGIMQNDGGGA